MFYKILILCIIIFTLLIFIAKITIDYTFNEIQCSHIENISQSPIIFKVEKI